MIILAAPVNAILQLAPTILDLVTDQVVIDMGSTKENILKLIENHPKRGRYVAAHPMAGTEYSGPEAAIPNLFKDKMMVYVEAFRSDEDAFELADSITEQLEMKTSYMNANEHDVHTAYVSHISHLTSFALALTVLGKENHRGVFLNWQVRDLNLLYVWLKVRRTCGRRYSNKTGQMYWKYLMNISNSCNCCIRPLKKKTMMSCTN